MLLSIILVISGGKKNFSKLNMEEGKIISALWYDDYQLKLEIFDSFNLLIFVKLYYKIADKLEHCGIISKSNRTLYEYGLRQMFATILNILTMLLIGFIMGLAVPAMIYIIAYIPLRVYAGGYHASTPQRCWAFSAIMLWIALCIVKYTPQMYFWVITTLSLIACIVVFLLSPVEDRNKRLDEKEHHVYHIRAIVVMTIEAVAAILLFVFHFKQFVLVLEIAWCSLAVMLLLGKGKNVFENKKGGCA